MAEQEAPAPLKSLDSHDPTYVVFINKTNENAEAWWLNFSGIPVPYGAISPGNALQMDTYTTHPWVFRASDGFQLLANLSEVYFPEVGEYEEDGYPLYKRVHVTAPVYSLQEYCTRMIRKMVRKEDVNKLEIAAFLKKEISRAPNLRRDLKVLAARRATNGS
ncbi:von Hippel-Lindau-like protein isoform X1 [Triplophysa dalaica]|uniref:von Hippel-Lindau-like protein isoform X1 n=1 Tax=Triplophysa dalaica TaxID=1582913 RepID=UPI0024DFF45E|nr:von Hippel-Lindau-like protein isoform X1 [Triplophysa dalaica]